MQRGSVLPLLLIFGLVLAIGVGVFYSQAATPMSVRIIPSPSPKSQAIFDELTGLKFEIPKGFNLKKETESEYFKRAFGDIRKNFNYYVLYTPAEFSEAFYVVADSENDLDKAILTVWVFKNPENQDAKSFYAKYWYYPFVWGDFTAAKNKIAPESIELISGKEGAYGIVDYRDGKPKFIYLPLRDKNLMLQIHLNSGGNLTGQDILRSFQFE